MGFIVLLGIKDRMSSVFFVICQDSISLQAVISGVLARPNFKLVPTVPFCVAFVSRATACCKRLVFAGSRVFVRKKSCKLWVSAMEMFFGTG